MTTIAEMQAKLQERKTEASALLDKIEAAGTFGADDDDNRAYTAKKAEIQKIEADLSAAQRLAEERRQMAPAHPPARGANRVHDTDPARSAGFRSFAEFAASVRAASRNGVTDPRLFASSPSNVHTGDDGDGTGFLVPAEYRDGIWEAVAAGEDDLLARFNVLPTQARSIEFIKDETTPWGAAGIQAHWRVEQSQMSPSKMATKGGRLELNDLYAFAAVSEETLSDAPLLQNKLTAQAGAAIRYAMGEAVMWGDGVGKPLGFMNAPALVTVAKESAQAAATIVTANASKMYSRLLVPPSDRPFWVANRDVFPQLPELKVGDTPVFMPPNGMTAAPNGMILGYPIVYSEHAQTLGTLGDLVLVAPGGYMAASRNGTQPALARSIHLWFDYALEAFRWTVRMGGQPMLSAPVDPDKGSNTKSHFVALATRA